MTLLGQSQKMGAASFQEKVKTGRRQLISPSPQWFVHEPRFREDEAARAPGALPRRLID
jgi:hypothetical protein